MPVLDLSVTVESIIQTGFASLIANATTQVPVMLSQFPATYQNDAVTYLTDPAFKVSTVFGYMMNPSLTPPVWNIILSNESESPSNNQEYLNDTVEAADNNPNTEQYEQHGSDWVTKVNVLIRAEKDIQTIVLYALTKWIFLNNRQTLEAAGMKTPQFSGSDLVYDPSRMPTFNFTRMLTITARAFQTVDTDISGDPVLRQVISAFGSEVRGLPEEQIGMG